MNRRVVRLAAWAAAGSAVIAVSVAAASYTRARQVREALYAAFTPVRIVNCTMQRYGSANDGGYLMCANFMPAAQSGYSYGIGGSDQWGCDVGAAARIPIHEYDCYDTTRPSCAGASMVFHEACVAPEPSTIDGRTFDTIANHVTANGDTGKRLVVKMDIEGAEWRSLAAAPEHVLSAIDQMSVEFHGVEQAQSLETAARLHEFFYVAHVHQNNYECVAGYDPFPGPVFEVLFVSRRIAVADPWADARGPLPLDAPNWPQARDCQASPGGSELQRVARWTRRYANRAIVKIRDRLWP